MSKDLHFEPIKNLVGLFGLSFTEDHRLDKQFMVVGDLREDPPAYAVMVFDWAQGMPNAIQVWPLEAFYPPTIMYRGEEAWRTAAEALMAREREQA